MYSISAPKVREFCSTLLYSKDRTEQEEFRRVLLGSAKEEVDNSIIGAPGSFLWGNIVGFFLGDPIKWGNFASTLSLTANRVNDTLQLTFAGMNAGMNRNPNIILAPNQAEIYHRPPSAAQLALSRLISRIQPAIAADIVNEGLSEDTQISERGYKQYFVASTVVRVLTIIAVVFGVMGLINSRPSYRGF